MITLTNCHFPNTYDPGNGADLWFVTVNTPKPALKSKFVMKAKQDATLQPSYTYDRIGAAEYAIGESRTNFNDFPVGVGSSYADSVIGSIGGRYTYNTLTHRPGNSGSAYFMSEAIHVGGGLPMILGTSPGCLIEPPTQNDGYETVGWRVCCEQSPNRGATGTWRAHKRLLDFFALLGATPRASAPQVNYTDVQQYINFINGTGTWKANQYEAGRAFLHGLFASSGPLANVKTGDYVFLDQGINEGTEISHGFLIVGWGEARSPEIAMNAQVGSDSTTFSLTRRNNGLEVPYVADFCYGFDGEESGWLQDPRPRPFYCSAALIAESVLDRDDPATPQQDENEVFYGYFVSQYKSRLRDSQFGPFLYFGASVGDRPNWKFIQLPDQIALNAEQIYTIPSLC